MDKLLDANAARFLVRRRAILAAFAAVALGWNPRAVRAQAPRTRPLVGFLSIGEPANIKPMTAAFLDGMHEHGYVEGQGFDTAYRYAEGHLDRLPALAGELAQLKPDVIVAPADLAALAAKKAAPSVPIVASAMTDPVNSGLIESYAHPGGMVTGILSSVEGMEAKQLELALELIPGASKIGILVTSFNTATVAEKQEIEVAATSRGIKIVAADVRTPDEFTAAFASLAGAEVAVVIPVGTLAFPFRQRVAELAAQERLPMVYNYPEFVQAGGLISYGVNPSASIRRAAYFIDKIFKGVRPAELPVEFPTTLEMAINLKAAKALGLTIPPAVMLRADEVIE